MLTPWWSVVRKELHAIWDWMLNGLTINTSKTSAVLFLLRQMGVALNLFNGGVNIDLNVETTKLNFWGYLLTKTCSGILTLTTFHGKLYEPRIWNQVKLWSSQLRTQFLQLPKDASKIQDFNRVWTRDLAIPVRRSNQLSYEATDVRVWSFVGSNVPVRNE